MASFGVLKTLHLAVLVTLFLILLVFSFQTGVTAAAAEDPCIPGTECMDGGKCALDMEFCNQDNKCCVGSEGEER
jgi:hypothetical protein